MTLRSPPLPAAIPASQRVEAGGFGGKLLAADRLDIAERRQPAVVVVLEPARLIVDDLLELQHAIRHSNDLIDLLLILDDAERHLGVRQHIGHFVGDRVSIDRHRHRAERLAGAHRPIKTRPVATDDAEFVAALEPERRKTDREGADLVEHLRPGPGLPDAEVLVAHGRTRPERRRIVEKQLGQRV